MDEHSEEISKLTETLNSYYYEAVAEAIDRIGQIVSIKGNGTVAEMMTVMAGVVHVMVAIANDDNIDKMREAMAILNRQTERRFKMQVEDPETMKAIMAQVAAHIMRLAIESGKPIPDLATKH